MPARKSKGGHKVPTLAEELLVLECCQGDLEKPVSFADVTSAYTCVGIAAAVKKLLKGELQVYYENFS